MKIRQIIDSRNQKIVAVEKDGELRCYFKDASLHAAGVALATLRRDIDNHGEGVVKFSTLPAISVRVARSGRKVYDVEAA